jgi:hypothetical protein
VTQVLTAKLVLNSSEWERELRKALWRALRRVWVDTWADWGPPPGRETLETLVIVDKRFGL